MDKRQKKVEFLPKDNHTNLSNRKEMRKEKTFNLRTLLNNNFLLTSAARNFPKTLVERNVDNLRKINILPQWKHVNSGRNQGLPRKNRRI